MMAVAIRSTEETFQSLARQSSSSPPVTRWVPTCGAKMIFCCPQMRKRVSLTPCTGSGTGRLPWVLIRAFLLGRKKFTLPVWISTSLLPAFQQRRMMSLHTSVASQSTMPPFQVMCQSSMQAPTFLPQYR